MAPHSSLERPITIRPRPADGAQVHLPNGLVMPARRYLWYYVARWPDGKVAATFHPGEGVVVDGYEDPWRVMRHDGIRTLLMPSPLGAVPLANLFQANAGLFAATWRVTLGEARTGGYELTGKGWRGGMLRHEGNGPGVLSLDGEGDPPTIYRMEPARRDGPPLCVALLVAYVLIEREIREGAWVKRPVAA